MGDVPGDLPGVEAAVLDEPAARRVAAAHRAGEVDTGAAGLERGRVEDRRPRRVVADGNPEHGFQEGVSRGDSRSSPAPIDWARRTSPSAVLSVIESARIELTEVLKYALMLPSLIRFSRSGLIQYLILSDSTGPRTTRVTSDPWR